VNYHEYTDMLVKEIGEAFEDQGLPVEAGSERYLGVSVLHVNMVVGGIGGGAYRCYVDVRVETGGGYVRGIEGLRSASNPQRACNAAIADGALKVATDPSIQRYATGR
jgi:hypothetical protein